MVRSHDGQPVSGYLRLDVDSVDGILVALDSAGKATFTVPASRTGRIRLAAYFFFFASADLFGSSDTNEFEVRVPTSTVLTPNPAVVVEGQALQLVAQVTAADLSLPTGAVEFFADGVSLGSVGLDSNGSAGLTDTSLAIGAHDLHAVYTPTGYQHPSTAAIVPVTVIGTTGVVTTASPANPSFGDPVTLTAQVTGNAPTGSVSFTLDGDPVGTAAINAGGSASLVLTNVHAGGHSVIARYSGDAQNAPNDAATIIVDVAQSTTQTTLLVGPPVVELGDTITVEATVVRSHDGQPASGDVRLDVELVPGPPVALDGAGKATFSVPASQIGLIHLDAYFLDNTDHIGSGAAKTVEVRVPTSIVLTPALPVVAAGSPLMLSAQITADDASMPYGIVEFFSDGASIGVRGPDASGKAELSISSLDLGAHDLHAVFTPWGYQRASTSATVPVTIVAAVGVVTTASPANPSFGDPVTLTAQVTGNAPTGSVSFTMNGDPVGTAAIDASGSASLVLTNLHAGGYSIETRYDGDAQNAPNDAAKIIVSMSQARTQTTLRVDPEVVNLGDTVTIEATVVRINDGQPASGDVRLDVDSVDGTPVALDSAGKTTFTVPASRTGRIPLAVYFFDNADHFGSGDTNEVEVRVPTSTVLTPVSPTVSVGQTLQLLARVTTDDGTVATGQVEVFSDGVSLGIMTLDGAGEARLDTTALTAGPHDLQAVYLPSGYQRPSTSALVPVTITAVTTLTTAFSPVNPVFGDTITLTATATGNAPTGNVSFTLDGAAAGDASLNGSGVASIDLSSPSVGTYAVLALYEGDGQNDATSAPPVTVTVSPAPVNLALTLPGGPIVHGEAFAVAADLGWAGGALSGQTVWIEIDSGGGFAPAGQASTDAAGHVVVSGLVLPAGNHSVRARVDAASNLAAAATPGAVLTIGKASPAIALVSLTNPSIAGQTVDLRATLSGAISPGGTVTLLDGSAEVATLPLALPETVFNIASLTAGSHGLMARYNGDANHEPATSPVLTQTVDTPLITVTPTTLPMATAGSPYASISPLASGGTAPHTFSLSGALPDGLSFASGTLSGTPSQVGSFDVTITATDSSAPVPFTGTRNYSIVVQGPTLLLPDTVLPDAAAGTAYAVTLNGATGGIAPYSYVVSVGTLPAGLSLSGGGVLSGVPTAAGVFNFTITATDATTGTGAPYAVNRTFALNVTQQAPVAVADSFVVTQDTVLNVDAPGLLVNDTDVEGDPLMAVLASAPASGTLTLRADGGFSYTPEPGFVGVVSFAYRASDGTTQSDPATATITVEQAPPTAGPVTLSVPYGSTDNAVAIVLGGGVADRLDVVSPPSHGTVTVSGLTLLYTPASGYAGPDSFSYGASNGGGTSAAELVDVTVLPPSSVTLPATALPGANVGTPFLASISPANGGSGSYSYAVVGPLPAWLSFDPASLQLSGTPTAAGPVTLTVRATDTSTGLGPFSADQTYVVAVAMADTSLRLISSSPISNLGDSVTFTAELSPAPASGMVSFVIDGNVQTPAATLSGGRAIFSTSLLTAGGHTIAAHFAGDTDYGPAVSAPVSHVVQSLGSLIIRQHSEGGDAVFGFSSPTAQLNLSLATLNGHAQSEALHLPAGTYTITADDLSGLGFGLAGIACSDDNSATNISNRTASIALDVGETLTCTFSSVNSGGIATGRIADFLTDRAALLLANTPDVQRRIDRLNGMGGGGVISIPALMGYVPDLLAGETQTLSASLSAIDRLAGNRQPNPFDIWMEGTFALFDNSASDGKFAMAAAGADYLVNHDLLIGGFAQIDRFARTGADAGSGTGWLAGPYVTARLADNLYLDLLAAAGASANRIGADSFDATRWLLSASLQGEWQLQDWTFAPRASLSYFEETSTAYTDGFGVDVPAVTAGFGRIALGPAVSYRLSGDGELVIDTGLRLDLVTDLFNTPNREGFGNVHGRIEGTVDLTLPGGARLGLSAAVDGIGANGLHSLSSKLRLSGALD